MRWIKQKWNLWMKWINWTCAAWAETFMPAAQQSKLINQFSSLRMKRMELICFVFAERAALCVLRMKWTMKQSRKREASQTIQSNSTAAQLRCWMDELVGAEWTNQIISFQSIRKFDELMKKWIELWNGAGADQPPLLFNLFSWRWMKTKEKKNEQIKKQKDKFICLFGWDEESN